MEQNRRAPSLSPSPFRLWLDRVLSAAARPAPSDASSDPARAAGLEMVRKMMEGGRRQ